MTAPDHDALLKDLVSGDDDRAEAAALALGQLGDIVLPAVRQLLSHPNIDMRWWATRAIGEIGSDAAIPALIDQCADLDPDVRACAIYALGRLGQRAIDAVPTLTQRLADVHMYTAQLAADALACIGKATTPALVDALKHGTPPVRGRAARALAHILDPSSIPALIASLEDESPIVEYYADIALQKMGVGSILLKV